MTQITSSEYYDAIQTIAETVRQKKGKVTKEGKYAPLLIIEALDYWKNSEYLLAQRILEDEAYYLADSKNIRQQIAFHLSRIYKQMGADKRDNPEQQKELLKKSEQWASYCTNEMKNTLLLSIKLIQIQQKNGEEQKKIKNEIKHIILDSFSDSFNNNISQETTIDLNLIKKLTIDNLSQWTALTVLASNELVLVDLDTKKLAAKKSLEIFQDMVLGEKGSNLKVAWYLTMAKLAMIINDKEHDKLKKKYLNLCKVYYKRAEYDKVEKLFVFHILAKVSLKEFKEEMERFDIAP